MKDLKGRPIKPYDSGVPSRNPRTGKTRRTRPEDDTVLTKPCYGARRKKNRARNKAARQARRANRRR